MIWPCQHNPELLILTLTDSCPVFQHTCHNTVNDWLCWAVSTDACRVTVLPFHESCCWSLASTWRTTCGRTTALMQRMLTCCRLLSWWMRSSVRECQHGRSVASLRSENVGNIKLLTMQYNSAIFQFVWAFEHGIMTCQFFVDIFLLLLYIVTYYLPYIIYRKWLICNEIRLIDLVVKSLYYCNKQFFSYLPATTGVFFA